MSNKMDLGLTAGAHIIAALITKEMPFTCLKKSHFSLLAGHQVP